MQTHYRHVLYAIGVNRTTNRQLQSSIHLPMLGLWMHELMTYEREFCRS